MIVDLYNYIIHDIMLARVRIIIMNSNIHGDANMIMPDQTRASARLQLYIALNSNIIIYYSTSVVCDHIKRAQQL